MELATVRVILGQFMSYEIVNGDSRQFHHPFLKSRSALSYMTGQNRFLGPTKTLAQGPKDSGVSCMDPVPLGRFEADFP